MRVAVGTGVRVGMRVAVGTGVRVGMRVAVGSRVGIGVGTGVSVGTRTGAGRVAAGVGSGTSAVAVLDGTAFVRVGPGAGLAVFAGFPDVQPMTSTARSRAAILRITLSPFRPYGIPHFGGHKALQAIDPLSVVEGAAKLLRPYTIPACRMAM